MIIIYTTCPNEESAEKIAAALLEEKVAACANWWHIRSLYYWKGKKEQAIETALILKTDEAHADACVARVQALHPYDVPCILRIAPDCNSAYFTWLQNELS